MPNNYQPSPENVCAVVVTLNPDASFPDRLQEISNQVSQIVVVDNGSLDLRKTALQDLNRLHLIQNPHNQGVAIALNQGFDKAIKLGYAWVLTLDQDSWPENDMLSRMQTALAASANPEKIAIIAPRIADLGGRREARFLLKRSGLLFRRILCEDTDLISVTTVITSGALINISAFESIGAFREDLFIDYVDTEFCLRARLRGYKILVACKARLMHQFGARKRLSRGPFNIYPSFHSPERWYTLSRNRIPMIKAYAWKIPHWFLYEITATLYILLRMLLTEDRKTAKLGAVLRGTWDGLRGRLGPPYWSQSGR